MGVTYTEGAANELAFTSRLRIQFNASGETDGGLAFGGSVRADNASDATVCTPTSVVRAFSGTTGAGGSGIQLVGTNTGPGGSFVQAGVTPFPSTDAGEVDLTPDDNGPGVGDDVLLVTNGGVAHTHTFSGSVDDASLACAEVGGGENGWAGSVFISGAFGKLSMGDVAGAAEFVVGDLDGVGLTGLGDANENVYLSNAAGPRRPAMRYEYSIDGFTFAASADNPGADVAGVLENVYAIGVAYGTDMYKVSLGYETSKVAGVSIDHIIAGASVSMSGFTVKAVYGEASDLADFKQYGLSATYEVDAIAVTAFHRQEDFAGTVGDAKYTGIGASYDLGGGASVVGGIVSSKVGAAPSATTADVGVSFSF